jgi:hypothetical protein
MRLALAIKRETNMGEQTLLFLMDQEQAHEVARLPAASRRTVHLCNAIAWPGRRRSIGRFAEGRYGLR